MVLLSGLIMIQKTFAACPNACSGHGVCGEFDSCICHTNYQGGDCSQRVCQYNWAWATSPNGDVNLDGDVFDSTQYSDDYRFSSSAYYLQSDAHPGGTWESWPSTHSTSNDEGHFYMECSNRGICDRQTGLCTCFNGYEGASCRRSVCPNDCSENGICLTVNELLADHNSENSGSRVYTLWDGDMAQMCKCDPGYMGPDCSQKVCPHGDDPLTTDFQIHEVQWIDIYSTLAQGSVTNNLDGKASFTYTDYFGDSWTTDPIDVMAYDASTTADQMATDLEAELEALPNSALTDVSVSAGFCETVLPNRFLDFGAASTDQYNSGTAPSGYLRCPGASAAKLQGHLVVDASDQSVVINSYAGSGDATYEDTALAGTAGTGGSETSCNQITYPQCVRFKVEFTHTPGDLSLISVDISEVTLNQKTNAQDATMVITSAVRDQLPLVTDSLAVFGYDYTPDEVEQTTGANDGTITLGTKTISFGTATVGTLTFVQNSRIALYCTVVASGVEFYLGEYTVSATSTGGADIVVIENIRAPNSECVGTAGKIKVKKVSHYVTTNVDLSNTNLVGHAVEFSHFTSASQTASAVVESVFYEAAAKSYIFFVGATDYTADVASAAGQLIVYGKGTKENKECGDRGICNRDSGVCECFRGYTGDSCSVQDALAQ
eukprot:augustus_masked-scaffold_37-processed-gene-2.24-mRNA-1 protein AED:0.20 eAED:0.20 QI:0/-1/0/1/-1/1/1/0/660